MHYKSQQFSLHCNSLNYLVSELLPWLKKALTILPLWFCRASVWGHFKRAKLGTDQGLHSYSNRTSKWRRQLKFTCNLQAALHHSVNKIQTVALSKSHTNERKKKVPFCFPPPYSSATLKPEVGQWVPQLRNWIKSHFSWRHYHVQLTFNSLRKQWTVQVPQEISRIQSWSHQDPSNRNKKRA